jgi:hypothetical protein
MPNKTIGIQKPSVKLSHVTENDAILEIHHQDSVTFISAFVPVNHQQMMKITTAWFDNLTKEEQRKLIEQLQRIVDLS